MKLTKSDIEKICKVELATKLDLSIGTYYAKKAYDTENRYNGIDLAINELINSEILKQIKINCPDIEIVMPKITDESEVFILSEDLATLGKFKTAWTLGLKRTDSSSLYSIWNFLCEKYRDNEKIMAKIPEIFEEIVTIYLYDIFMGNWDRLADNWGLIFNEDESEIIDFAVFDNEYHLDNFMPNISTLPNGYDWLLKRRELLTKTGDEYEAMQQEAITGDLKRFFYESSKEFYDIFENLYNTLTPEFYASLLNELEQTKVIHTNKGVVPLEIASKNDLIKEYNQNYELISGVWKEARHGRK